ncbi:FbpB family small basic protein [Bacillus sp. JCM 19034]|uniref:FbpB family small basic protein n=1 Tax=Bacillus sp. JCM 19034 TaxID=1481928 RepID=UPI0009E8999A|nr:FbpB family small basic protein [Bacillus sp. JCM 19034]
MRKQSTSFENLVEEYKQQLLKDPKALDEIEQRLEERQIKASMQNTSELNNTTDSKD